MLTLKDVPANQAFIILDFPAGVNKAFVYKKNPPSESEEEKKGKKKKRKRKQSHRRLYEVIAKRKAPGRYETTLFRGPVVPFSAAFVRLIPEVFR